MTGATLKCCGGERLWSRSGHKPDCPYIAKLRLKSPAHPALRPAAVPPLTCPAHPLEDYYECPGCERRAEERREANV